MKLSTLKLLMITMSLSIAGSNAMAQPGTGMIAKVAADYSLEVLAKGAAGGAAISEAAMLLKMNQLIYGKQSTAAYNSSIAEMNANASLAQKQKIYNEFASPMYATGPYKAIYENASSVLEGRSQIAGNVTSAADASSREAPLVAPSSNAEFVAAYKLNPIAEALPPAEALAFIQENGTLHTALSIKNLTGFEVLNAKSCSALKGLDAKAVANLQKYIAIMNENVDSALSFAKGNISKARERMECLAAFSGISKFAQGTLGITEITRAADVIEQLNLNCLLPASNGFALNVARIKGQIAEQGRLPSLEQACPL